MNQPDPVGMSLVRVSTESSANGPGPDPTGPGQFEYCVRFGTCFAGHRTCLPLNSYCQCHGRQAFNVVRFAVSRCLLHDGYVHVHVVGHNDGHCSQLPSSITGHVRHA